MKPVITAREILPGTKVGLVALVSDDTMKSLKIPESYYTSVFEANDDHSVEINVPFVDGHLTTLLREIKYGAIFTTSDGLYRAVGVITKQYKKENFYIYHFELTSKIERYQRRSFYRLNVLLPLYFITLDDRAADIKSMQEVRGILEPDLEKYPSFVRVVGQGNILDISGGGIKFNTEQNLRNAKYVFVEFHLESEHLNEDVELIGEVRGSYKNDYTVFNTYRVQFHFKDSKFQEKIVQYIFDKERLLRKKEQGS